MNTRRLISLVIGTGGVGLLLVSTRAPHPKILGLLMVLLAMWNLRGYEFKGGLEKKKSPLLPLAGTLIICGNLAFNHFFSAYPTLMSLDKMTILFGVALIAYNYVPPKFETEMRFITLFFGVFAFLMVAPTLVSLTYSLLVYNSITMEIESSRYVQSYYVNALLTAPLVKLLNLCGIGAIGTANTISFAGRQGSISLVMGVVCSGAFSFATFVSAFSSYILTEYRRIDVKVLGFLAVGLITVYLANMLRMLVISLVGFFYGGEALIAVHQNAGWAIFMVWIFIFWYLAFRFLDLHPDRTIS